ncbi:MAG: hypothetical protein IPL27_15360 [Lewinellaceae bacterium]|nr:hypothetical protein [Lewinellaceae bacterium]
MCYLTAVRGSYDPALLFGNFMYRTTRVFYHNGHEVVKIHVEDVRGRKTRARR